MVMTELKLRPQKMSLLVHVVDDLKAPEDYLFKDYYLKKVKIRISHGANFIRVSRIGIFYFSNLAEGDYTVTLSCPNYVTEQRQVTITSGASSELQVRMKPGYDYKVYGAVAFIRGAVVDALNNRPIAGVRVRALARTEEALTDEKGRYMLYFKDVIDAGGESIDLTLNHSLFQSALKTLSLLPGQKITMETLKLTKL